MKEKQSLENQPTKFSKNLIILIIIVFLSGFILGRFFIFLSFYPFTEKPESFESILQRLKEDNATLDYSLFLDVFTLIKNKYVKQPVSEKDLFYGAISGLVMGLKDPFSVFFPPEMAKKFKIDLTGVFEGIGAEIGQKKNRITIIAPLPETPAEKAGLKAGDEIYTIDDEDTLNMSLDYAVSKIRGPKDTQVKLLIFRKNWEKPKEFVIKRGVIKVKTVSYEMKDNEIAYLKISYFNEKTVSEFEKAVKTILFSKPKGLILDLRNNPGGYLYAAIEIASIWLGDKVVVFEKGRKGEEKSHSGNRERKFHNLKTVVLINKGSASGAEILAGALQDYGLAKLIGEKTFGKGSVQELEELRDGSMVKITTAYWLTPNKRLIDEKGIEPDFIIEMTEKDYEEEKDPQFEKAIELLKF